MTKEELKRHCKKQIEECERWAKYKGEEPHGKIYEEHKLILELLEQEPCEDAISREELLKKCVYVPIAPVIKGDGVHYEDVVFAKDIINAKPLYPKAKWIPVSERLPEEQDYYLVTTKWKGSYSGNVYIEVNMAVFREKPKEWDCEDVIAWMPLPQPYKAESEE